MQGILDRCLGSKLVFGGDFNVTKCASNIECITLQNFPPAISCCGVMARQLLMWIIHFTTTPQMIDYFICSPEVTSSGSRISVRGMRRGSGSHFFRKGWPQLFYCRLLARIGVARIFRGWMRPGVDPGFLDFEGPERGAVGAKSADGVESGEGRRSPSPVWGSGGIAPRKFLKFNLQICAFWCIFAPVSDSEFNATCSNFRSLGGVRRSSLGGGTGVPPPKCTPLPGGLHSGLYSK